MPARHFTRASSEFIGLALGALGVFGPGTMVFIVRPTSLANSGTIFSAGSSNTVGYRFVYNTSGVLGLVINAAAAVNGSTGMTVNKWYLVAVTKATGTATPRFHIYDFATNTWTHENAGGTAGNSSAPTTQAQISALQLQNGGFCDADIAMGAVWNVVLTDSQVEALAYDLMSWFAPAQPKGLWILDQDPVTMKVPDLSGGGANENARTGTSLGTSSVPVFSRGPSLVAVPS